MCHVCVLHKTIFMCLTLLTVFLKYISKLLSLSAGTSRALIRGGRAWTWSEHLLRAEALFRLEIGQFGSKNIKTHSIHIERGYEQS